MQSRRYLRTRALLVSALILAAAPIGPTSAMAQFDCELQTQAPKAFSQTDALPVNDKRIITTLNESGPLQWGSSENVALLNREAGYPGSYQIRVQPWKMFQHEVRHDDFQCGTHLIFSVDVDNDGAWDYAQRLERRGTLADMDFAEDYVTIVHDFPEPQTFPGQVRHELRWKLDFVYVEYERYGFTHICHDAVYSEASGSLDILLLRPPSVKVTSPDGDFYVGYTSSDSPTVDRPLLIVEGIDEGTDGANRNFPSYYFAAITEVDPATGYSVADVLNANGYDIFVYNFANSSQSMRCNAMGVLGALMDIRSRFGMHIDPTRVLGISMGGVVSRYALAWGEEHDFAHGCDFFGSIDAPQQGAWVSLAFQNQLKPTADAGDPATSAIAAPLRSEAGLQLLRQNAWDPQLNRRSDEVDEIIGGPIHQAFYDELRALNANAETGESGYPRETLNVGVSFGRGDLEDQRIPSLMSYEAAGGTPLVHISVNHTPLSTIYLALADVYGGSQQPAFEDPFSFAVRKKVFEGMSLLFFGVGPVYLRIDVSLETPKAPCFIPAFSALDLQNYRGGTLSQAAYVVGWDSTGFDEVYMVPLVDPVTGIDTKDHFHDELPSLAIAPVIQRLIDMTTAVPISGRITGPGGIGVPNVVLQGIDGLGGLVVTNEEGYYSGTLPFGHSATVIPSNTEATSYTFIPERLEYPQVTTALEHQDFVVSDPPDVAVRIGTSLHGWEGPVEGVGVFRRDDGSTEWVRATTTGSDGWSTVYVPWGWSGNILPLESFGSYSDSEQGADGRYDGVMPGVPDWRGEYIVDPQWDEGADIADETFEIDAASFAQRGIGSTHFFHCPLGDGPPVVFEVSFLESYMKTAVPGDLIRLEVDGTSYPSVQDLTLENGYTARFELPPVTEAFDLDVVVKFLARNFGEKVLVRSGYVVPTVPEGRTCSFRNLDLSNDGAIELRDLAEISKSFGLSEGDPGFILAADFAPELAPPLFAVTLGDVSVFAAHFRHAAVGKAIESSALAITQLAEHGRLELWNQGDQDVRRCAYLVDLGSGAVEDWTWEPSVVGSGKSLAGLTKVDGRVHALVYLQDDDAPLSKLAGSFVRSSSSAGDDADHRVVLCECDDGGEPAAVDNREATSQEGTIFSFTPMQNPSRGASVDFRFTLAEASKVSLELYDLRGRLVATVLDEFAAAGSHTASWDGESGASGRIASGVYFAVIRAGNTYVERKKVSIVR